MKHKKLMLELHKRPIAFYPVYVDIFGSITAAVLFSQIMYWWEKMDGEKFYKTDAEIMEETRLSPGELKSAKRRLKQVNFIRVTVEDSPAKTFYDIDAELLVAAIAEPEKAVCQNQPKQFGEIDQTSLAKLTKLERRNQPNQFGEIDQTPYKQKNTQKITSKITQKREAETSISAPFDKSDIEDFEAQIETNTAPVTIIVEEEKTASPKSRKSSKKTLMGGGAFFKARQVYDEAYRNWMRKTGAGVDAQDGIYWNKKEIGSLSNLLKAIRSKATAKGKIYPSDLDFVENAFADFIQTAANLQVWYLNDFSPSNLNSKFNALYADVVVYFKTGKNNGHGTTQHKNGRNGHQFDAARTAYMESLLDS